MAEPIERLLPGLGKRFSLNAFIEEACREIIEMAESSPEHRTVPKIVRRIDAAREENPAVLLKPPAQAKADRSATALLKKEKGKTEP